MIETVTPRAASHRQVARWGRRNRRRLRHHLALATASAILIGAIYAALQPRDPRFGLSMATAYTSLALLGATLALGPLNILRARANPVSSDLRRDVGIWAALVGVTHVAFGLQVHFRSRMWLYFLAPAVERGRFPLRLDQFGVANHTGLVATLILVLLLALSNDLSLRRLGRSRWKTLQQLNYALFALVGLHGLLYQHLERRPMFYVSVLGAAFAGVIALQLAGAWWRVRDARHPER